MKHSSFIRWTAFVVCIIIACIATDVSPNLLIRRGSFFFDILADMVPPHWNYADTVWQPLVVTVQMSAAGTLIGAVSGLVAAWFANVYINRIAVLRVMLKFAIHVIRTIPALILALLCTFIFGLGTFSGTVALSVYTFAILARLTYEDMENADYKVTYALEAMGCSRTKAFSVTVLRQIMPGYMINSLYVLEANVRHAAILGYVGAGGIGFLLHERLSWREYADVGMVLSILYVVVFITEAISERLKQIFRNERTPFTYEMRIWFSILCVIFVSSLAMLHIPQSESGGWQVAYGMLYGFASPDFSIWFLPGAGGMPYMLFETLCIAFLGTVGGSIIAFILAFTSNSRLVPWEVAVPVRLLVLGFRSIPVIIFGLMWMRVTGPGPFAGVMTLVTCSVGLLVKRFLIAIDTIDLKAYNAYRAMGISSIIAVRHAVIPQLMKHFVSAVYYRFDINLRETAVLGLVGAGGVGTPLVLAIMHYEWNAVSAILLGLFALISVVEIMSEFARKHI